MKSYLTPGSAATDTGINAGVTTDIIDGDARILDDGYDIGADEFFEGQLLVYLPLTVRNH